MKQTHWSRRTAERIAAGVVAAMAFVVLSACVGPTESRRVPESGYRDWKARGGGFDSIRYSALDQINRNNVRQLEVAWSYDSGDSFENSEMECNPVVADDVLYATTPKLRVIALDAATGELRWSFDPFEGRRIIGTLRNRGVTYWEDGDEKRIYFAARQELFALDAKTGKPVPSFGNGGRVDLREGLGRDPSTQSVSMTSPGVVYQDLLIVGSIVSEALPAAPGDIRAYDLRTGKIRWSFHTIPHPGEFGYDTWPQEAWTYIGGANAWGGLSLDAERGLVFCPTGSAAFDFYGANRLGDNLFANSLIVLDAATGKRVWHFQTVKHDVWDRDLPTPPSLVRVMHDGGWVDAAAQITKSGHVYLFERQTGTPLFPIEDRKTPQSLVDGEVLAETQPLPLKPLPFARQILTEDMLTQRTAEAHEAVLDHFRTMRSGGQFEPPSEEGTIIFPGLDGGGEWGGGAFDPETGLFYVNSNEMSWILKLVERPLLGEGPDGRSLYLRHCSSCHKEDLSGTPPEFPALTDLSSRLTETDVGTVIYKGSGRMPGYAQLGLAGVMAVTKYVMHGESEVVAAEPESPSPIDLKYMIAGYDKFLDPDGYPAVAPPWGTLNAINLDTGEIVWKIPFGEIPELVEQGLRNTGSENYGGPVVTAGGLLLIGATNHDKKFHAFDKATGELLWDTVLPAAGNATPAIYEVDGRQYVVIAAGGGKWGNESGGTLVAFALPKTPTR